MQAEAAARELGRLGLIDALDYLALLAAEEPKRFERPARRWLIRLLRESDTLSSRTCSSRSRASRARRPATSSSDARRCGHWSSADMKRAGSEAGGSLPNARLD
jgi:hypothetical protein